MSSGDSPHPSFPKSLSLEQAQIVGIQRRQDEMMEQIAQLINQMVRFLDLQQRQHKQRENEESNDDDAASNRIEQPNQRGQQKEQQDLKIKMNIPSFKGQALWMNI